jgi:hypothetical protein
MNKSYTLPLPWRLHGGRGTANFQLHAMKVCENTGNLTSELDGDEWPVSQPGCITPGKSYQ